MAKSFLETFSLSIQTVAKASPIAKDTDVLVVGAKFKGQASIGFLYKIPIEKLRIKENQIIKLYKKGVPCINIKDIYNAKNKNNIYLYVELIKTS